MRPLRFTTFTGFTYICCLLFGVLTNGKFGEQGGNRYT
jgi:hypothetical protein